MDNNSSLRRPSPPLHSDSFTASERLQEMSLQDEEVALPKQASIFAKPQRRSSPPPPSSSIISSDPFVTLHSSQIPGIRPRETVIARALQAPAPKILAVEIGASSLRPLAFRVFTKKHNLTLKSEALSLLCSFIGRKCGAEWRTNGSAEKLLEEVARTWKRNEGAASVLVEGNESLKAVLKGLDMPEGAARKVNLLAREESFDFAAGNTVSQDSQTTPLDTPTTTQGAEELDSTDPRQYLYIIDAFTQPKYNYNPTKKQFERAPKPKLLPLPTAKPQMFHTRYNITHHRLLRNPSFQPPTFTPSNNLTTRGSKTFYKLTPIANLLGRSGQPFLLFGMLSIAPDSGALTLEDPSGHIQLDISQAVPVPENGAWFNPGSLAVVDGIFETNSKFTVFTIGQPPSERREQSAEVFGHIDLMGINIPLEFCTKGTGGRGLRKAEQRLGAEGKGRVVVLSDVHFDLPRTQEALTKLFTTWEDEAGRVEMPLVCILCGKFVSEGFAWGGGGMAYKEALDRFSTTISYFPKLLTYTSFVFIPSDSDPWTAAFTGGASGVIPRKGIPDVFTSRIKRVFSTANSSTAKKTGQQGGKAVFASNPARIAYFTKEIVVFRDELGGRFVRNSVRFKNPGAAEDAGLDVPRTQDEGVMEVDGLEGVTDIPTSTAVGHGSAEDLADSIKLARKLVKTILDQSFLSPYPVNIRPLLWDYTHTLSLFPLPSYLILADPTSPPFCVTYEGCVVINPGRFLVEGAGRRGRFAEFGMGGDDAGGKGQEFYY